MQNSPTRELVRRWLLAVACFAVLIFFFSPSWAAFDLAARVPELRGLIEARRGASVWLQAQHPGVEIADDLHAAIQWRLVFPLLGYVLHLPATVLFGLAPVGCVLVLAFLASLLRRQGWTWFETSLGLLVLGSAEWFFASTGWLGYYDAWLVLGLLTVAFAQRSWLVWLACLLTPWVDERFLLGMPLAWWCRFLAGSEGNFSVAPVARRKDALIAAALLGVFAFVRFGLLKSRSASGATLGGYILNLDIGDPTWQRVALGLWEGLRLGWVFVAAATVVLLRRNTATGALFAAAVLVVLAVALSTAQDFGRSVMLGAPAVVLGFILSHQPSVRWVRTTLRVAAGATLLLPAHHVMSDRVTPIFYLYHELAAFGSPPPAAMPELHELRGIHAMERGDYVSALESLSLAIKLAPNPAGPAKQRGILFASHQRWKQARDDFALVVQHEPKNPDGWFLRAQAQLALGDKASAESDARQALALAPKGWTERPDVARFFSRLQQGK